MGNDLWKCSKHISEYILPCQPKFNTHIFVLVDFVPVDLCILFKKYIFVDCSNVDISKMIVAIRQVQRNLLSPHEQETRKQ